MRHLAPPALLLALLLALAACGQGPEADRIDALEAEVKALRQEAGERDKAYREELAQVRRNLEDIQALLKTERSRDKTGADTDADKAPTDEELDAKAKSFVDENLDRLLDLTRKLLDKMESEMGPSGDKSATPPKGDEI